jgi:hypothetical protein
MSIPTHPLGPVEPPTEAGELLVPIILQLAPIRRLLVIDIEGDPTYRTLEPQLLDDAAGDLVLLLAYRHDEHLEVYAPTGRDVDPAGYTGLGKGLEGIHHGEFEQGRFEVTGDGLKLDLAVTASNGRRFDLHLHEHLTGPRDRIPTLAPVGGSFDTPEFFPFLWLPGLSFVPVQHTQVDVRVDGASRSIPRLPVPLGGRRCLMARYDPDVQVCQVNPDSVHVPTRVPAQPTPGPRVPGADVVETDDGYGIAAVRVGRDGHTCAALLDPPLPDLQALPVPARRSGAILLQADDSTELRGRYELTRTEGRVDLLIEGFGPWRTRTRRPLLAVLFRLPVFRRWPTTYRWQATLDLTATAQQPLISRWSRSL